MNGYLFKIKFKTIVLVFTLMLLLLLPENTFAQNVDYSGTSAANFLKVGVGARVMAMGDAAIATVDGPTAMYWNIGALSRIKKDVSVSFSTMNWLVGTRNSYVAGAMNLGEAGTVGADIQYLDYGTIEETTVYDQDGTGRFFSASDFALGLGYSRQLTDRFSFGIKVKYIREDIANASADAFGIDVGAVFLTSFFNNNMRIAASLANFGSKMKFKGRDLDVTYSVPGSPTGKQIPAELATIDWEIPLLFRFGVSNYFVDNETWTALAAVDILDSRDYAVRYNVGGELGFMKTLYLRGGYKFNYDEVSYTFGVGLDFNKFTNYKIAVDYLFLNYGVFGNLNQFSIRIDL